MTTLLNTLYIQTQGAYVHIENDSIAIGVERKTLHTVPLHHIGSIVTFGNVMLSPHLIARCSDEGRCVALMSENGKFLGRFSGKTSGNVLLRRAQHTAYEQIDIASELVRSFVVGKIVNYRSMLLREVRENPEDSEQVKIKQAARHLKTQLDQCAESLSVESLRGVEGDCARAYFEVLACFIRPAVRGKLAFEGRNRRPPRDPVNALLSFLYTLIIHDCTAACEGVGLDPQVGFLHVLRPGRSSLALDLAEEFRAYLGDRLALTLLNRRQLSRKDFDFRTGGAVYLNEKGRKSVLVAYQKKKQEEVDHPLFKSRMSVGLIPHLQARLLARVLRGDVERYVSMGFSF